MKFVFYFWLVKVNLFADVVWTSLRDKIQRKGRGQSAKKWSHLALQYIHLALLTILASFGDEHFDYIEIKFHKGETADRLM